MILRLGFNAASHAAAGAALGFLGVLAACTVAQLAAKGARDMQAMRGPKRGPVTGEPMGSDPTPPAGAP